MIERRAWNFRPRFPPTRAIDERRKKKNKDGAKVICTSAIVINVDASLIVASDCSESKKSPDDKVAACLWPQKGKKTHDRSINLFVKSSLDIAGIKEDQKIAKSTSRLRFFRDSASTQPEIIFKKKEEEPS